MNLPKSLFTGAIALALTLASQMSAAGIAVYFECNSQNTHYEDRIAWGGTFQGNEMSGYCVETRKLVHTAWKTSYKTGEKPESPPLPIRIFDPTTGQTVNMYKLPKCSDPIIPIESEEQLRRIPPCLGNAYKKVKELEID